MKIESTGVRILSPRKALLVGGSVADDEALTNVQPGELVAGALCLAIAERGIYEWRPDSTTTVNYPKVVAGAHGSGVPGRWHVVGLVSDTNGWDLEGQPLSNYYDFDSGAVALGADANWYKLWSMTGTSFIADTMVRRIGLSVAFEANAASLKDDEQLVLTVTRTGATYNLCDKTNRTPTSTSSITGTLSGLANGLSQNWRLRLDGALLRFEIQGDAGGARTARGRFWFGEEK